MPVLFFQKFLAEIENPAAFVTAEIFEDVVR